MERRNTFDVGRPHLFNERYKLDDGHKDVLSRKMRVYAFLFEGKTGTFIRLMEVVLSIFWCATLVAETYVVEPYLIKISNYSVGGIFCLLYLFRLYYAENRLLFVVSVYSFIDYITIIPAFIPISSINILQVLSILRIFRLHRIVQFAQSDNIRQIFYISFCIISFLFISTALMYVAESSELGNFHTSFYFVVVTIFTVGFGDYTPTSEIGRLIVIIMIFTAVVLIPLLGYSVSRLVGLRVNPLHTAYSASSGSKHTVIFCASLHMHSMNHFLTEFLIKFRVVRRVNMHLLIVLDATASLELTKFLVAISRSSPWVHVYHGTPLNSEDLERVDLRRAESAVLIYEDDNDTCLANMAIRNYRRDLPIYALVFRPEMRRLMKASAPINIDRGDAEVVLISRLEICHALIARSVHIRGFCTLISNLVRSRIRRGVDSSASRYAEYDSGFDYEIYFGVIPTLFSGVEFFEVCKLIYQLFNSVIIGFISIESKQTILNPGFGYLIQGNELGVFLARDSSIASKIKDIPPRDLVHIKQATGGFSKDCASVDSAGPVREVRHPYYDVDNSLEHRRTQISWYREVQPMELVHYYLAVRDSQLLQNNYQVLDSPRTYRSAQIEQVPKSKHIIIYGVTRCWPYIIAPLRSKVIPSFQPIVIATPDTFPADQWQSISHFPEVYFLSNASLLRRRDLDRLSVETATHVILLDSEEHTSSHSEVLIGQKYTELDLLEVPEYLRPLSIPSQKGRDILLIYSFIKTYYPHVQVILSLQSESTLRFLHRAEYGTKYYLFREFRNGMAFSTMETLHRILAQTVYNPLLIDVVNELVFGKRLFKSGTGHGNLQSTVIRLDPVPKSYCGRTYETLFCDFIQTQMIIPIGLYRTKKHSKKEKFIHYVFTCPPNETILEKHDLVYLLLPHHH
ncbi:calcium-activated potassium channel slo-1-like [Schistocerca gregaria]|uniref:calcium-activated potassium channel slo-1-like n=1 Tax=Schistocerca gregaria TaxID=7010 RepID=UPI00211EED1B|nr:calcium-activated potassium channel slo-1-like [Schistocerca gregaria]